MNKLMTTALVAGGLMLMNAPEATAHKEVRNVYQPQAHYQSHGRIDHGHIDTRRSNHMPRWLQRDQSFRKWYKRTSLKRNRHLAWNQLFDIYRWERRFGRTYYRSDNYWNGYYAYRYGERQRDYGHDRERRDRRRHRH